jgi:hypothetical protein
VGKANTLQCIHASGSALGQLLVSETYLCLAHRTDRLFCELDLLEDISGAAVYEWNAKLPQDTNAVFQQRTRICRHYVPTATTMRVDGKSVPRACRDDRTARISSLCVTVIFDPFGFTTPHKKTSHLTMVTIIVHLLE